MYIQKSQMNAQDIKSRITPDTYSHVIQGLQETGWINLLTNHSRRKLMLEVFVSKQIHQLNNKNIDSEKGETKHERNQI